jgi:hypothetical protein
VNSRRVIPYVNKTNYIGLPKNVVGTAGAQPLPRQTCGMFTKQTGFPGRTGRGRFYAAFPSASDQSLVNDLPTAGYMTRLGALAANTFAIQNLTNGASTCDAIPVLFSRVAPSTSYTLVGATARTKWATHRSRGDYGRPNLLPTGFV